jgi:hypothetical protein
LYAGRCTADLQVCNNNKYNIKMSHFLILLKLVESITRSETFYYVTNERIELIYRYQCCMAS